GTRSPLASARPTRRTGSFRRVSDRLPGGRLPHSTLLVTGPNGAPIRLNSPFDFSLPVHEPVRGPDPVEPPAQGLQMLLAQPVPVPGRRLRVVRGPVTLNGEHIPPRLLRMHGSEVDPVLRHPILRHERDAVGRQGVVHILFELIHGDVRRACLSEPASTARRILEVLPEE